MDRDTILRSIEPKSDQLNADDLIAGPIDVTIVEVCKGNAEQPIVVKIEGQRPWKPCKSMRRLLVKLFSDTPSKWIGQRLRLFCDPDVAWAGVKVGGIRVSHATGITSRTAVMLTSSRGKRTEYIIEPMPEDKPTTRAHQATPVQTRVDKCVEALGKVNTYEALQKLMPHVDALLAECDSVQAGTIRLAMDEARMVLEG